MVAALADAQETAAADKQAMMLMLSDRNGQLEAAEARVLTLQVTKIHPT